MQCIQDKNKTNKQTSKLPPMNFCAQYFCRKYTYFVHAIRPQMDIRRMVISFLHLGKGCSYEYISVAVTPESHLHRSLCNVAKFCYLFRCITFKFSVISVFIPEKIIFQFNSISLFDNKITKRIVYILVYLKLIVHIEYMIGKICICI